MNHIKGSVISNLTDEELLASVHHAFPNVKGLLKQLVDRFEEIIDRLNLKGDSAPTDNVNCPNCGTTIPVDIK